MSQNRRRFYGNSNDTCKTRFEISMVKVQAEKKKEKSKKHTCSDCTFCQWCSDERCGLCRPPVKKRAKTLRKKAHKPLFLRY